MEKNYFKLLMIFIFCLCFSTFAYVNASTYTSAEILSELDQIKADIVTIKSEYADMLTTYSSVIDSLSTESKTFLLNLTSNVFAADAEAKLETAKSELELLGTTDADDVLTAIYTFEAQASAVISDSKLLVFSIKYSMSDYTSDEVSQIVNSAKDIVTTFGVEADTTSAYNQVNLVIDNVKIEADKFQTKLNVFFANHAAEYKKISTPANLISMLDGYEEDGLNGLIVALKDIFKNSNELTAAEKNAIKADLAALEQDLINARNVASGLSTIDNTSLLLLNSTQISNIKSKVKAIMYTYTSSIELVLNNYADDYLTDTFSALYDESISVAQLVEYANSILDYVDGTKEATDVLSSTDFSDILDKLNISFTTILRAYSLSSALGIDVNSLNYTAKLNAKIANVIQNVKGTLALESVKYANYVSEATLNQINTATAISDVLSINCNNFTTLEKLEALIERLVSNKENMLASAEDNEDLKANINSFFNILDLNSPTIYSVYYRNILIGIDKITKNETVKVGRKYEVITDNTANTKYFVTSAFLSSADIATLLSIPENYASIVHINSTNVKTSEGLSIEFSNANKLSYTCVVLGDVYSDGKISSQDYMAIKNNIMGKDSLDKVKLMAADTYRDGEITSQDYMAIKNQIMGKDTISLEKGE